MTRVDHRHPPDPRRDQNEVRHMPSPWAQRMEREQQPAQPVIQLRRFPRCMANTLSRHQRCKRGATATVSTTNGGVYCRQHARLIAARSSRAYVETFR